MNAKVLAIGLVALQTGWCVAGGIGDPAAPSAPRLASFIRANPDDQPDPGQAMYKEGYDAILAEQWAGARKKFSAMLAKHPKSVYARDAEYWSAYAQMHLDKKKAMVEYKEFLNRTGPSGRYYSDALSDFTTLQSQIELQNALGASAAAGDVRVFLDSLRVHVVPPRIYAPGTGFATSMPTMQRKLRHLQWRVTGLPRAYTQFAPRSEDDAENELDEKTRLRLVTISAIGENGEDDQDYELLKGMAQNPKEPVAVRAEALEQLTHFSKHESTPFFLAIAKSDTNEEIQGAALECLTDNVKDKDAAVNNLIEIFDAAPSTKIDRKAMIMYHVADIGNDRAVDFLGKIAKTDKDYDLRAGAVDYLGNIGSKKAKAILYEILKTE